MHYIRWESWKKATTLCNAKYGDSEGNNLWHGTMETETSTRHTRPSQSRFKKLATNNRKKGGSLAQSKNTQQPDDRLLGKERLHSRPRSKHQDPSYKNKTKQNMTRTLVLLSYVQAQEAWQGADKCRDWQMVANSEPTKIRRALAKKPLEHKSLSGLCNEERLNKLA